MDKNKQLLANTEDAIANCMKCGNCMEVCPVYQEIKTESSVARGKLALIEAVLSGKAEISEGFAKRMALCLACKSCAAKCPCGVKADELILRGRQAAVKARGLSVIKKNVFKLLSHRVMFDFILRMAGLFGPLNMKKLPGRLTAVARFPMPGLDRKRVLAPFATTPLRSQFPEIVKVPHPRARVAFFTGCVINYVYTDIGQSVINVLKANGLEVNLPAKQHCCGTPVYMSGDVELAKVFAKHNIETMEHVGADYIITACGSCAEAFKIEYPEMLYGSAMHERARKLAAKTYEISEFLVDVINFRKESLGNVNKTVTMHDPCHMVRGVKITIQPRTILKAIPGLELVEMKEPARCCGAGGSFSLANYELSRKINDHKIADIAATTATTVATGCGSCRMHITDGLVQHSMTQDCVHVVQLLDKAYRAGVAKA